MRTKTRLNEESRRSLKLSLSCFLSYFFLSCLLCFSIGCLESKYSCNFLALWPDVFLSSHRHSLVSECSRPDFSLNLKKSRFGQARHSLDAFATGARRPFRFTRHYSRRIVTLPQHACLVSSAHAAGHQFLSPAAPTDAMETEGLKLARVAGLGGGRL